MERFGQCLREWMKMKDLSTADVTELVGYRSKTSVQRALRGESNSAACRRLLDALEKHLDTAWMRRFRFALEVESVGPEQAELFWSIDRQLFDEAETLPAPTTLPLPSVAEAGELLIFGYPHEGVLGLADQAIASDEQIHVMHYLTADEIVRHPALLAGLIARIPCTRYRAALLPGNTEGLTWNTALFLPESGKDAWCLLFGIGIQVWRRLEGAVEDARALIEELIPLRVTMLYQFDRLINGSDFLQISEEAYRLEHGRAAAIVKPSPSLQMLPIQVIENVFREYLAENTDPIAAMRESLISIYKKRVDNFYHRNKPTLLYFSLPAITDFIRDGFLSEQFFSFRPFNQRERRACLDALHNFAQQDNVRVRLRKTPAWPIAFESYGGCGVVLYPSEAKYSSLSSDYRELFLPGKVFTDLFFQYTEKALFGELDNVQLERSVETMQTKE